MDPIITQWVIMVLFSIHLGHLPNWQHPAPLYLPRIPSGSGRDLLWICWRSSAASSGSLTSDSARASPVECSAICANLICNRAGQARLQLFPFALNLPSVTDWGLPSAWLNRCCFASDHCTKTPQWNLSGLQVCNRTEQLHLSSWRRSRTHPWTLYPGLWLCRMARKTWIFPSWTAFSPRDFPGWTALFSRKFEGEIL